MNPSGPRLVAIVILASLVALIPPSPAPRHDARAADRDRRRLPPMSLGAPDAPAAQAEMEFLVLRDPRANAIPRGIRARELRLASALPARRAGALRIGPDQATELQPLVWAERGPNNVGG